MIVEILLKKIVISLMLRNDVKKNKFYVDNYGGVRHIPYILYAE